MRSKVRFFSTPLTIFSLFALSTAFTLGGCSGSGGTSSIGSGQDAVFSVNGGEPTRGLIPAKADDQAGVKVIDLLFAGLVTYDKDGSVVMDLAKEITPSKDFKTWTITLNQDRKFSDGSPVKAKNFVQAWKQSAAQALGSTAVFSVIEGAKPDGSGQLTGVSEQGEYQIEVKLQQIDADFPARLGITSFYPLPDSAFGADGKIKDEFGKDPIGNGPYKLKKWLHGSELQLVKSDTYVGPRKAENGGVTFKIFQKASASYNALLSDQLDVLDNVSGANLDHWEKDLQDRRVTGPRANAQTIDIDYQTPHFSGEEGKLRRRAISQAIDREAIVKTIFRSGLEVATDFLPAKSKGHTDKLPHGEYLKFDPKAAKAAWEKANQIKPWKGKLPIAFNTDQDHRPWVEAVAHQLTNNLGVNAVAEPVPSFSEMLERMDTHSYTGPFRMGWTLGYPSPSNLFNGRFVKGGGGNKSNYDSAQFNQLLEKALSTGDETQKMQFYTEAQDLLVQDLPVIPLWTPNSNVGFSKRVSNVELDWKGEVALHKVKVTQK